MEPPVPSDGINFATTHWSLVLSAAGPGAESRQALAHLCQAYWPALYAYVRRRVRNIDEAQDLTQAFFARLLEKNYLAEANPHRGRFRAFLITLLSTSYPTSGKRQRRKNAAELTRS